MVELDYFHETLRDIFKKSNTLYNAFPKVSTERLAHSVKTFNDVM